MAMSLIAFLQSIHVTDSFPDILVRQYNSGKLLKLSELIDMKRRLLIWIPPKSCGICIRETMKALAVS